MKVYRGIRDGGRCHVRVVERRAADTTEWSYDLPPRPDLFARPPAPFEWGTDGPGVVHLAAALLVDRGTDARAVRALVPYFRRMLSRLPPEGFEVSDTFLDAFAYAVSATGAAGSSPATLAPAAKAAQPLKDGADPDGVRRPSADLAQAAGRA